MVAARYANKPSRPLIARKFPESVIMTAGFDPARQLPRSGYRFYGGCILQCYEDGLALDQIPPLNVMCPKLFLPFQSMEIHETSWGFSDDAFAIRMDHLQEVDIIVDKEVVQWMRGNANPPPFDEAV